MSQEAISQERSGNVIVKLRGLLYFTGYDGSVLLSKELKMPFHGLRANNNDFQFLPRYLRYHRADYNILQRRLFHFFKLVRNIRHSGWSKIKSKLSS